MNSWKTKVNRTSVELGNKLRLRALGSNRTNKPLPSSGFGGGSFGGAGYGTEFGESVPIQEDSIQYIRRTPIPGRESFSTAFKRARDNGDPTFIFNGREFTTEISDNPEYVGKRYQPTIDGVVREVLDKDMKSISDSLRIEPYIGQMLGVYKRKKGGILKAQSGEILVPHKDYLGVPYRDFNTSNYDYFGAHFDNIPTNEEEYWSSRNPVTGQLLKSEKHPTFDLMLVGEKLSGMEIYKGLDGNLYSKNRDNSVEYPYRSKDQIDFSNIKTTNNRAYDQESISYINQKLQHLPDEQRAVILGTIIEESGGNPFAKSKNEAYQGLLQWASDRYRIPEGETDKFKLIDQQLDYLLSTINNISDRVSWTHGGTGSNYKTAKEAYMNFNNEDLWTAHRAFSYGYVRPLGKEDSANNRFKVVKQIIERFN